MCYIDVMSLKINYCVAPVMNTNKFLNTSIYVSFTSPELTPRVDILLYFVFTCFLVLLARVEEPWVFIHIFEIKDL